MRQDVQYVSSNLPEDLWARFCKLFDEIDLDPSLRKVFDLNQLLYYSCPMVFGNTVAPFGGIGGQAVTTKQVEFWLDEVSGYVAICVQGRFFKFITKEEFQYNPTGVRL